MNHFQNSSGHNQGGDWSQGGQSPQYAQAGGQPHQPSPRGGARVVAQADENTRSTFIRRTYAHLVGAVFLCVALMALFVNSPFAEPVIGMMFAHQYSWLIVLAIFMGFSWMGDAMAHRVDSKGLQYIGLTVGVGAYAIILTPLVLMAAVMSGPGLLINALLLTFLVFGALTAVVFVTGFDFSILRIGLIIGSVLALGAIVGGVLFGFTLGLGFAVAMVGLSSAMIVYQTSNVLHQYHPSQHVGAALGLFSSLGMLFWYILSIFMSLDG